MARNRNRVVQILMDRDGITADEAKQEIRYCRECIYEAIEMGDMFADDIIEDIRSQYHRLLIVSKFKDDQGRYRIMVTNGSQNQNGQFKITFKGEYAKYNVDGTRGYLCPGGAKVIDLFDSPPDPANEVLD